MHFQHRLPALPQNQKGIALMMVLFVFALVTILASGMISRQSLFIQKTANAIIQSQAYEYALGAEMIARQILFADWESDKKNSKFIDHNDEDWSKGAAGFPIDYGVIEAQLDDLQGKLNINSVVNADGTKDMVAIERFKNLFLVLDIEEVTVEKLVDWIDSNSDQEGIDGGEDGQYLIKENPYRTGNQPFVSTSELMLIDGMTFDIYTKLTPHVAALPPEVKAVNINTCSKEILRSLVKGKTLSDKEGQAIIDYRTENVFVKEDELNDRPEYKGLTIDGPLSVNSEFFQVAAKVSLVERISRLVSVLYRDSNNGKLTLLQRNQGQKYLITKQVAIAP